MRATTSIASAALSSAWRMACPQGSAIQCSTASRTESPASHSAYPQSRVLISGRLLSCLFTWKPEQRPLPYGPRQRGAQTNNAGGILGGISTGMPIVWQMAVKPTPSIGRRQQSVDLDAGCDADLVVRGLDDPCIVPRAVPVAEAVCALALLDLILESQGHRAL